MGGNRIGVHMLTVLALVYYGVTVFLMNYLARYSFLYGWTWILSSFILAPFLVPLAGTSWVISKFQKEEKNSQSDSPLDIAIAIWLIVSVHAAMIIAQIK